MPNAAAGWYPVEDGRQRYWDGESWTEHFHDPSAAAPVQSSALAPVQRAGAAALGRIIDTAPVTDPEAIWHSVGRPLSGIGAGRYRMTSHYLFFEKGALRTDSQQVPISAVVDVDVRQSMTQKARGVFSVLVHVQRSHGIEIVTMEDIPDGREAQRIINDTAHQARLAIQRNQNTHRHENTHLVGHVGPVSDFQVPGIPTQPQPVQAIAAAAPDPIDQLRRLGELRDAGIVTEEEFAAKKAEVLGRM